MLHLKQIQHNIFTMTSKSILKIKTDLQSLGVVPQNLVLVENLGKLLLSLMWLVIMLASVVVTSISSLLSLIKMTLKKLQELWTLTETPGYNVQYILCRWEDVQKNITSMFKKSQKSAWKEDGDLPQGYTSAYSEMPGGPKIDMPKKHYKKEDRIIDIDAIRKSGY